MNKTNEKLSLIQERLNILVKESREKLKMYSSSGVEKPLTYSKIEALKLALEHVRCYNDRMYLQFLIKVEERKQ